MYEYLRIEQAFDLFRQISHQPTRRREKQLIKFKNPLHANNFSFIHGQVGNLFWLAGIKIQHIQEEVC